MYRKILFAFFLNYSLLWRYLLKFVYNLEREILKVILLSKLKTGYNNVYCIFSVNIALYFKIKLTVVYIYKNYVIIKYNP